MRVGPGLGYKTPDERCDGDERLANTPEPGGADAPSWPRSWLRQSPALLSDPIVQSAALVLLTSALFLLFPAIDVWFSGLFYDASSGFPMERLGAFVGLRAIGNGLTWLIVAGLIVVLLVKLALPERPSPVAPRAALFILSTLLLGPGLIVNLILKDHWGRPRPWRVDAFGGDQPFVGVWHMTNYCSWNCSFVSGEASSAIWLLTAVVLVPPAWRPLALKILFALAVLLSLNRIAMGGHFLSDTLLSWGITLFIIAVAYRLLYLSPPPALAADRLEDAMTRAGSAIRRAIRRSPAT